MALGKAILVREKIVNRAFGLSAIIILLVANTAIAQSSPPPDEVGCEALRRACHEECPDDPDQYSACANVCDSQSVACKVRWEAWDRDPAHRGRPATCAEMKALYDENPALNTTSYYRHNCL